MLVQFTTGRIAKQLPLLCNNSNGITLIQNLLPSTEFVSGYDAVYINSVN